MVRASFSRPFSPLRALGAAGGVALWLLFTALSLTRELAQPTKFGIAVCAALILTPLVLAKIRLVPALLFAAYAALIPFTDLLATSMGGSFTKFVGIAAAGCIFVSMLLRRRTTPPSATMGILVVLALYAGITVFWAIDPERGLSTYGEFLNYMLFYALVAFYPATTKEVKLIAATAVAGGVGAALTGGYLFWHAQHISDVRVYMRYSSTTYMDPNEYAASLLLPIAIALVFFVRSRIGLPKLSYLAVLAVLLAGFAVSGSRGVTLGLVAMVIFLFFNVRRKTEMLLVAWAFILVVMSSPIGQRFFRPDTLTGNGRTNIWTVGIGSLKQYWMLGAGPGNFQAAFNLHYLSSAHTLLTWGDIASHSLYLQSAIEYGIGGFALVMALWYSIFHDVTEAQYEWPLRSIALAVRASIIGLLVAGFSLDLLMYKYTWLAFSLAALARSACFRQVESRKDATYPSSTAPV